MENQNSSKDTTSPKGRKRLGELLIDSGLIDDKTLKQALEAQKGKNKKIGQVLIEMGVVDDIQIAKVLSTQLKIPFISLEEVEVPKAIISLVPAEMAENYLLIPIKETNGGLLVAMANPLEFYALDDLRFMTHKSIEIAVSPQNEILDAIERHYPKRGLEHELRKDSADAGLEIIRPVEDEEKDIYKLMSIAELPPVVRFVNTIFADAIKLKASDIHIEPQKTSVIIRYRMDGIMREIMKTDKHVHASMTSRIKVLANMDISERRKPQDGRTQARYAGKNYDLRVSSIPTSYGENLTLRILDPEAGKIQLEELGLAKKSLGDIKNALDRPQGIIIVTGPTGSGKSSTLYTFLNRLNSQEVNIITVEDPIEFDIDGINQVQINPKAGITFAEGLRSILRQDPDIVMVGEIRDRETATITCQAAQTGHMVLSTLHTNNAPSAITRLMDLGVDAFVISDSLVSVVAQRLVRKICSECKVPDPLSPILLKQLPPEIIRDQQITFFKGNGCQNCRYTGYSGRLGIFEVLMVTPSIQEIISPAVSAAMLKKTALKDGFSTLGTDGITKAAEGITTIEEILRVAPIDSGELGQKLMIQEPSIPEPAKPEPDEQFESLPSISTFKAKKILVVDDDEMMLKILVNILETENYSTITASNGLEAMQLVFLETPDLILTDLVMPEMDGMTLLKKLKSELSTRLIPIIIISVKDEVESEVKLINAGADDFISKPVEASRLVARVNRLLRRTMN